MLRRRPQLCLEPLITPRPGVSSPEGVPGAEGSVLKVFLFAVSMLALALTGCTPDPIAPKPIPTSFTISGTVKFSAAFGGRSAAMASVWTGHDYAHHVLADSLGQYSITATDVGDTLTIWAVLAGYAEAFTGLRTILVPRDHRDLKVDLVLDGVTPI